MHAASRPAGPAPTTITSFDTAARSARGSVQAPSRPTRGFTKQVSARFFSRFCAQPWLQPMHGRTSSARPACHFETMSGSAMCARAMPTMSAAPEAMISSASSGSRYLQTVKIATGSRAPLTAARIAPGRCRNIALSTPMSAICVPSDSLMWYAEWVTWMKSIATSSTSRRAISAASSTCSPSGTNSSALRRTPRHRSRPIAARRPRATSSGNRIRFSSEPPKASPRRFESGERNCWSRWPWPQCSSMPSTPAASMFSTVRRWPSTTAVMSRCDISRGGYAPSDHRTGDGPHELVRSNSPSIWRPR